MMRFLKSFNISLTSVKYIGALLCDVFIFLNNILLGINSFQTEFAPLCLSFELMNVWVIKVIIALLDDSEAQAERVEGAEEDISCLDGTEDAP